MITTNLTNMTQIERLTAEFNELDRVTPRPLTKEDYAICAIQFANELFKEVNPSIMKQLERAGQDYEKLMNCFEELDAIRNEHKEACYVIGKMSIENTNLKEENNRLAVVVSAQEKEINEFEEQWQPSKQEQIDQLSEKLDQLDEEYQDLARIATALYKCDKEAVREMINESLGGDSFDKFKDHLGV